MRPRRFVEDIALPPLPRLRLYDPAHKPSGMKRIRRKAGNAAAALVHGWLKIPARGTLAVRCPDGTVGTFGFDAHQSAYLAFASRMSYGGYEPVETLFLEAMLARARVFYDVGANWGYYSLLAATHPGFDGRIYAFDVSRRMNADLARLAETLRLGRIEVAGYGLSNQSGTVLTSGDRAAQLTTILDRRDGLAGRRAEARVNRLDDIALPPPDLMKIDVEDHEREVLEGGSRTLRRSRPLILFECREPGDGGAAGALLRSWGYVLYGLDRRSGDDPVLDLRPITPGDDGSARASPNLVAVAAGDEARWFG